MTIVKNTIVKNAKPAKAPKTKPGKKDQKPKAAAVNLSQEAAPVAAEKPVQVFLNKKNLLPVICLKVKAAGKAVPPNVADAVIDALESAIAEALIEGAGVKLGLGAFSPQESAAKKGTNPATGEIISVAARKAVRFKPSAALKRLLNAGSGDAEGNATESESDGSETETAAAEAVA